MDKANLKSYAPRARLDFIKAVTERANVLGISVAGTLPAQLRGDVAIIDGREWPAKVGGQRDELIARIKRHGFEQTMDEVAYTWFNRFAALRYMEIHDFLGHGWRVLSSRDGGLPEILRHACEVTLPGLESNRAREMQLAGNQDNELYKLLLVAQCNDLSRVMPFLFERIDDETELLLPENLLRTDSITANLVRAVPEEDWQEIEVIGWLYQFYISEKKEEVIGKVIKNEDIPAATQLFTPNWIVQYLVQNSVGRLWLSSNPTSTLGSQWPYYIRPAEQIPNVQAQLDAVIQARIHQDGEMLNPETITVLDPACGSGHILVVAYDVLRAIYLERGYQPRSIPRLILEKNLYGLDIDDRAVQLAAFALIMKARADDRRLFSDPPMLHVICLKESRGLSLDELVRSLPPVGFNHATLEALLDTFEHAKTFGSLIEIPIALQAQLTEAAQKLQAVLDGADLYGSQAAKDLLPLIRQASILAIRFDAVVANPPYMGSNYYSATLKGFIESEYRVAKGDLYTCFIVRAIKFCKSSGLVGMITIPNWMFSSSYEELRVKLAANVTILSLCHNGRGVFGSDFGSCAFVLSVASASSYLGSYKRLFKKQGAVASNEELNKSFFSSRIHLAAMRDFAKIPGRPIAYWPSQEILAAFSTGVPLGSVTRPVVGLQTGDNERFIRRWQEVYFEKIAFRMGRDRKNDEVQWVPYVKGGDFRKWYGNHELVVDWKDDGYSIKHHKSSRPQNVGFYFRRGVSYTNISASKFASRFTEDGFIFDQKGSMFFADTDEELFYTMALLHSVIAPYFLEILCPTVDFNPGDLSKIPVIGFDVIGRVICASVGELVAIAKSDWDSREVSWDFAEDPLVANSRGSTSLADSFGKYSEFVDKRIRRTMELEEGINREFLRVYNLEKDLTDKVARDSITLSAADREKDSQRLVSYAIGCMMGRYSLETPGVIFANSENFNCGVDRSAKSFPADSDGIVPLTVDTWFEDEAARRIAEFLRAVWGGEALDENLAWLAEGLGSKGSETPEDTIRRYLADKFFKDHLQAYKKRPIYWLFSSGKQGAFQALVYLHRYNEGTLARMRAEYVVPLIAKVLSRLDMLDKDVAAASSAAARTKVQKQIESLRKRQMELLAYDEKLRHYTDMRITLDLDDGVKVNYAKFGDLVAEAKVITGGSDD